ncbi:MAG: hypothetical protein RBT53_10575, partial [Azonexus sp.]|nr:hypothetical protein [Azonexus sp.]
PFSIAAMVASSSARAASNFIPAIGVGSMTQGFGETHENTPFRVGWSNSGKIHRLSNPLEAWHVRHGYFVPVGTGSIAVARELVL